MPTLTKQTFSFFKSFISASGIFSSKGKSIIVFTFFAPAGLIQISLDLVPKSLKCNLTLGKKKNFLFDTGELGFDIVTTKGGQVHGQSRNFQYSKARNLVQTDLTPKGKDAGAKLGKVSSIALEAILKDLGLKRPESASKHRMIPPVGKWEESQIKYWKDLYTKLKISNMIDLGEVAVYEKSTILHEGNSSDSFAPT